jgi:hypothetical protein
MHTKTNDQINEDRKKKLVTDTRAFISALSNEEFPIFVDEMRAAQSKRNADHFVETLHKVAARITELQRQADEKMVAAAEAQKLTSSGIPFQTAEEIWRETGKAQATIARTGKTIEFKIACLQDLPELIIDAAQAVTGMTHDQLIAEMLPSEAEKMLVKSDEIYHKINR